MVKDQNRIIHHHYQNAASGGVNVRGPIIGWIGDEYLERWLRMGLVVEVDDASAAAALQQPRADATADEPAPNGDIVDDCIADLDRLDVAPDCGAPTCRKALRDNGLAYGNEVIGAAVKVRKQRLAAVRNGVDSS
ncbi:hypothetical protein [Mycobacterium avium]|uniref:hypothetical protein n=2 Tax=Mycobacteriaceae TaxID=1762 RepID=UPI001E654BAA|nr:hypothetical protein [Mycobacterium avium]MDV3215725.1 hypothetical protein [Mycobacterium avium]